MSYTIEQARKLKNKSQEDVAKILNIHVQTYRKIEKNLQFKYKGICRCECKTFSSFGARNKY